MAHAYAAGTIRSRISEWLLRLLKARRLRAEFDTFSRQERVAALHEMGLCETDLSKLINGHMSSGYIEQMLIKTGNSPAEIKLRSRSHWIALERNCLLCADWRKCRQFLEDSGPRVDPPGYCENRDEIMVLSKPGLA
jgi:hypothetical protein